MVDRDVKVETRERKWRKGKVWRSVMEKGVMSVSDNKLKKNSERKRKWNRNKGNTKK